MNISHLNTFCFTSTRTHLCGSLIVYLYLWLLCNWVSMKFLRFSSSSNWCPLCSFDLLHSNSTMQFSYSPSFMPVTFGTDTSYAQFSMFRHLATCVRMYVCVRIHHEPKWPGNVEDSTPFPHLLPFNKCYDLA